ncbi:membrane protein insertion efficiency factor YidD [Granulicella sp. WH15]|uniref:membrane protein insertion efficiency factor YidD n=1 Tax=Granulicella sp. WH15 TaxID=2602070 RepID=UPI001367922D|nr:membrane protein insertion efficiency factor YidD [Granulicella sp. WH15]QHN05246.1 membrane protein insertion efficiency factor YidD [Granulicella sp. WH15]
MKAIVLKLLFGLYKRAFSPMLHSFGVSHCIYLPTCSEYAYVAIDRFGWIKGTRLAVARVARCNPLAKGGFDPVPDR